MVVRCMCVVGSFIPTPLPAPWFLISTRSILSETVVPLVRSQLTKATVAAGYVPSSMIVVLTGYCSLVVWVVVSQSGRRERGE